MEQDREDPRGPPRPPRFAINPVVVVRIAGLPLDAPPPAGELHRLLPPARAGDDAGPGDAALCDALAAHLPAVMACDQRAGHALLDVKRALHNGRPVPSGRMEKLSGRLPDGLLARVDDARRRAEAAAQADARFAEAHQQALDDGHAAALRALGARADPAIRRALALTNPELLRRIDIADASPARLSRKDHRNAAQSAARQLLRTARKTSPLSAFGPVAVADVGEGGADLRDPAQHVAADGPLRLVSAANYGTLDYVAAAIAADPRRLSDETPVALNSSVRRGGDGRFEWRRIRMSGPEWRVRHGEADTNASASPFLRVLHGLLAAEDRTLGGLLQALAAAFPAHARAKADTLFDEAWAAGFVEVVLDHAAAPPRYARDCAGLLRPPLRGETLDRLDRIDAAAARGDGPAATAAFVELGRLLGVPLPADAPRPPIFEDAMLGGARPALARAQMDALGRQLADVLALVPALYDGTVGDFAWRGMVDAFVAEHGAGGEAPDALAEAIRLDALAAKRLAAFGGEGRRADRARPDAPGRARDRLIAAMLAHPVADGEARIPVGGLDAHLAAAPARPRMLAQTFFVQPFRDGARRRFVLNKLYPGAAASFSRFVDADGPDAAAVKAYLTRIAEPGGAVELAGMFGFNGCDHPRYTDRLVSVPPRHSRATPAVPLSRFRLRHRPEHGDLCFVDEEGRDVSVILAAVLGPTMMPSLERAVRAIGSRADIALDLPELLLDAAPEAADGTRSLPRISYGGIVLVRRQLAARKAALPSAALPEHLFYAAFNAWAEARALPRHLYARRRMGWGAGWGAGDAPSAGAARRKTRKPLPIDRHDALAVAILQKEVNAADDGGLAFAEALPGPDDAALFRRGRAHMCEIGVEVALPPEAA